MRYEPAIDRIQLARLVDDAFGIPVQALTFVPLGFDGASYLLHARGGERYFLKLWPGLEIASTEAVRCYATLRLTRALYDRRLLSRLSYPLPTRDGTLWTDLSGIPCAVYPLIAGEAPPFPMPVALRAELARTIAAIHRASPAVADVLPPRETFAIPNQAGLARCLMVVERIGSERRPGLRSLKRLLLPRRRDILAQYARLCRLQSVVRDAGGPFVLCHADLTGNNLLVDTRGRLSVLDWDGAAVAPPEHDLWAVMGEEFGRVLQAYREAGGIQRLHLEQFAFYLLRRYLRDMVARLERILAADAPEQEDEQLLRGIEVYGMARWAALDETLADIAGALA